MPLLQQNMVKDEALEEEEVIGFLAEELLLDLLAQADS